MKIFSKKNLTYTKKLYMGTMLVTCLFFMFIMIFFASKIFATDVRNEDEENKTEIIYRNENPIDLYDIMEMNSEEDLKSQLISEQIDIEYTTIYRNNSEIAKGVMQVLQEGRVGTKDVVIIKNYRNDELISEKQVAENIIKAPVERIVEIGTGNVYNNENINVGDNVYIASTTVAVRLEPNENSEKICTLNKQDTVKVMKIVEDWLFVSNIEIKGFLPRNCVTTKNSKEVVSEENSQYSKQQLLANLNMSMDLRKKSGFSLEQFKKVLSGNTNDTQKIFENNAEYFYYAEKQYGVNGIFIAAVGIHESNWGKSTIANNKKNLFGYGAVDSNPYGGAYSFSNYSDGIDLLARVFVKYYLNPKGTKIYDGTLADGKFYSGSTLNAVNSRYATDKNWANGVYKWMEYLYNRL